MMAPHKPEVTVPEPNSFTENTAMKRLALTAIVIMGVHSIMSTQVFTRHELAVDATPLLRQFLFAQASDPGIYPYYLMYRWHLSRWALRAGIGGSYWQDDERPAPGSLIEREVSVIDFRIGIERRVEMSTRWHFFYGNDLLISVSKNNTDYTNTSTGASIGDFRRTTKGGVSPLLGLCFQISNRLSLLTESAFQFLYYETAHKKRFEPDTSLNTDSSSKGLQTMFVPLARLFVAVRL